MSTVGTVPIVATGAKSFGSSAAGLSKGATVNAEAYTMIV